MIGDSLTSDMRGGENAGIDTCWYNPGRIANDRGAAVTMQAASHEEIRSILLPWEGGGKKICFLPGS